MTGMQEVEHETISDCRLCNSNNPDLHGDSIKAICPEQICPEQDVKRWF
jgi:hypothetical protein